MKRVRLGVAVILAGLALAACSTDNTDRPQTGESETLAPPTPVSLTFGAWGTSTERNAYAEVIDSFTGSRPSVTVRTTNWATPGGLGAAMRVGLAPDVFLATREQIQAFAADDLLLPVDSFLDARRVNLGDDVYRSATEALSNKSRLMCMPFTVTGKVVFYNTELIDFEQMAEAGMEVPDPETVTWTDDQFWQSVAWARVDGVYVEPTIQGLAPWLTAAGSSIFDRAVEPTSLTLTPGVLEPFLTSLDGNRAATTTPIRAFTHGETAVLVADRSVVPRLRASGVPFDAMPMPGSGATSGSVNGICINADTEQPETAADLMAAFNSNGAGEYVAATGSLMPANRIAVASAAFSQEEPTNTSAFDTSATALQPLPAGVDWDALEAAVDPYVEQLFEPGADLEALTDQINTLSRAVLVPEESDDSEE